MRIKPTRMELLKTKKRLKLAEKGHKLLKEKRDTLVMEFFETLKEIKELRESLGEKLWEADKQLVLAEAYQGEHDVERLAIGLAGNTIVSFRTKNIMGVKVPELEKLVIEPEWYSLMSASTYLESAVSLYRQVTPDFIKLVELQLKLKKLGDEIKKTKRRVNALEYITIPVLEDIKKEIAFKLEEMERENFTRLKKIKAKAEKRNEAS